MRLCRHTAKRRSCTRSNLWGYNGAKTPAWTAFPQLDRPNRPLASVPLQRLMGSGNPRDAAATVHAPAAAVGYPADLLDVDVHHVAGPVRDDPPGFAVAVSGRVEESASVHARMCRVPADDAHREREPVGGRLEGDTPRRPLLLASQLLDPGDDLGRRVHRVAERDVTRPRTRGAQRPGTGASLSVRRVTNLRGVPDSGSLNSSSRASNWSGRE